MPYQEFIQVDKKLEDSLTKKGAVFYVYPKSQVKPEPEGILGLVPVASLIVLLIFLVDRILGFFTGRHASRRTWYMDVIIKPNLEKIDLLFNDIIAHVELTFHELEEVGDGSSREATKIARAGLKKIKDRIYEFNYEFIYLVRAQDPGLEDQLLAKIEQTHDIASKELGKPDIDSINLDNIKRLILESKIQFYITLYASIRFKSIWASMWYHVARPFKFLDKITPKHEGSFYKL